MFSNFIAFSCSPSALGVAAATRRIEEYPDMVGSVDEVEALRAEGLRCSGKVKALILPTHFGAYENLEDLPGKQYTAAFVDEYAQPAMEAIAGICGEAIILCTPEAKTAVSNWFAPDRIVCCKLRGLEKPSPRRSPNWVRVSETAEGVAESANPELLAKALRLLKRIRLT